MPVSWVPGSKGILLMVEILHDLIHRNPGNNGDGGNET